MTTTYRVTYASAGCLPDGEPMYFDSLEDAAEHVADERAGICWMDASGYREDASLSAGDVANMLVRFGMVGNPDPDSLYRWSIDEVADPEVCAGTGRHDGQDVDSCDECCAD